MGVKQRGVRGRVGEKGRRHHARGLAGLAGAWASWAGLVAEAQVLLLLLSNFLQTKNKWKSAGEKDRSFRIMKIFS